MEPITISGRFFMEGPRKWRAFGASYGPFRPNSDGDPFPEQARVAEDFRQMRAYGLNAIRIYHVPPVWFMDLAAGAGIRLMVTLPWPRRGLFLESSEKRKKIEEDIVAGARALAGHPAVFACVVDNEMAPDLARWFGPVRVCNYLDHLIELVKGSSPDLLVTYAGYPPTEYLIPENVDFLTFNVYLHERASFRSYLQRLHNLAGERPLLIGEFGINVLAEGEAAQADILSWHIQEVVRSGASGSLLFCWTDEWFTGGHEIQDWAFGLVDRERSPRPICHRLPDLIPTAGESPHLRYPLPEIPKVSVIVCTYNGSRTIRNCLESLQRLNYPNYEMIVVDDGSTDTTPEILDDFSDIHIVRQDNLGLSAARNRGAREAGGEIFAYTDDDCMPDEDWLYHIVETFGRGEYAMVGGPNLSPPARNRVEAAVAAAPGAPTHVLLSDQEAEHIPGCNMAIRRDAFLQVGGFDPVYRKAGDDVDICWRLLEQGLKIGFDPSATVWHYRRSTMADYFKQQRGYGESEAILRFQHPNVFDRNGQAIWSGVIYDRRGSSFFLGRPLIYHGIFALGYFQSIYRRPEAAWRSLVSGLPWLALTLLVLLLGLLVPPLRVLPLS
jgi:GT2 family glycosyltransferase